MTRLLSEHGKRKANFATHSPKEMALIPSGVQIGEERDGGPERTSDHYMKVGI